MTPNDDVIRVDVQTVADYYMATGMLKPSATDVPCVQSPFASAILHFEIAPWGKSRVRIDSEPRRTVLRCAVGMAGDLEHPRGQIYAVVSHDEHGVPTGELVMGHDLEFTPTNLAEYQLWIERYFQVALLSLSFMHVKGATVEAPPTAIPMLASKRRQARAQQRIHTLRIEPLERVMREARASAGKGVAVHLVRGHFKDFRNGPGVGGNPKARGLYWTPPHVKGNPDRGLVAKHYETGDVAS